MTDKYITFIYPRGVIYAISESVLDWSLPVILVPKRDGSHRLCIDFYKVNAVTKTKDMSALVTLGGLYNCTAMPFGMTKTHQVPVKG